MQHAGSGTRLPAPPTHAPPPPAACPGPRRRRGRVWLDGQPARVGRRRPRPRAAAAEHVADPDHQHRQGHRLAGRADADACAGPGGPGVRRRVRPPPLAGRPAQRRRAGRRVERAPRGRDERAPGADQAVLPKAGRLRRPQRRPDHPAPRRRRRRPGRGPDGPARRAGVAVRDGAGRRPALRRQQRVVGRLPVPRGRHPDHGPRRHRRPAAGRHVQPALDAQRDRQRRREPALRRRRLGEQHRRARAGRGGRTRRDLGGGPGGQDDADLGERAPQPGRHGVGARDGRAVDGL